MRRPVAGSYQRAKNEPPATGLVPRVWGPPSTAGLASLPTNDAPRADRVRVVRRPAGGAALDPDRHTMTSRRLNKGFARDRTLMNMGGIDSDLEELYRRRPGAFQVMLASVTGSVESARDVVQEELKQTPWIIGFDRESSRRRY